MSLSRFLRHSLIKLTESKLQEVKKFRNIHRGESCYLIGDGVSLKYFDLLNFADKISIPCGFLPFHKDFEALNAPYMLLIEPWWFYPLIRTTVKPLPIIRNLIQNSYRDIIKKYPQKNFFLNVSNLPTTKNMDNVTYVYRDLVDDELTEDFITKKISAFHGSLRGSITMAIYMGFSDVHLIGYDYTHFPSRSLHWYEKGMGISCSIPDYNKDFFAIANDYINITTVTLDGTSEFLNSVSYESYTGCSPVFRENDEILNREHLKVLSSWPGYKIF